MKYIIDEDKREVTFVGRNINPNDMTIVANKLQTVYPGITKTWSCKVEQSLRDQDPPEGNVDEVKQSQSSFPEPPSKPEQPPFDVTGEHIDTLEDDDGDKVQSDSNK